MLKVQVAGSRDQIQSFMYEIHRNPSMELVQQENGYKVEGRLIESYSKCSIKHHPERRVRMIEIITTEGKKVRIPMLDMIQVEIVEGIKIVAGKTIDIFQ